jgi:hypothetical protein
VLKILQKLHMSSHKSLTIKRKLELIAAVANAPPGKRKKEIAADFKVPPSMLSTIIKEKTTLKAFATFGNADKKKRNREPSRKDVDEALLQWFTAAV